MALTYLQYVDFKSNLINSGIGTFILKVDSIGDIDVSDMFIHLTAFVDENFELKLRAQLVDAFVKARSGVSLTTGGKTYTVDSLVYDTKVIANHQFIEGLESYLSEDTPAQAMQGVLILGSQIYGFDILNDFRTNAYGDGVVLSYVGPNVPSPLPIT